MDKERFDERQTDFARLGKSGRLCGLLLLALLIYQQWSGATMRALGAAPVAPEWIDLNLSARST
jgi:hypothetical protein